MILKSLQSFIIVLVVLLIFLIFLAKEDLYSLNDPRKEPQLVRYAGLGDPAADIKGIEYAGGKFVYPVKIQTEMKFYGTITDQIIVVPVIHFKGITEFAGEKKSVSLDSPFFTLSVDREITSSEPPTIDKENNPNGKIMEKQTIVFNSYMSGIKDGAFTLTLESMFWEKYPYQTIGVNKPFGDCMAYFTAGCADLSVKKDFKGCDDCPDGNECDGCKKYFQLCSGTVMLKVDSLDCYKKNASVTISADRGKPHEFTEDVLVSFWKESDCVEKSDADELKAKCAGDYLGAQRFAAKPIDKSEWDKIMNVE